MRRSKKKKGRYELQVKKLRLVYYISPFVQGFQAVKIAQMFILIYQLEEEEEIAQGMVVKW